jgi:hypothetical protein
MKKVTFPLLIITFAAVAAGCGGGIEIEETPPDNDDGPEPTESGGNGEDG